MDLRSPSPSEHMETLAEIFAKTFTDYWPRRAYVLDGYIKESNYDWEASRIGIVDDEVATHFGVWDFTMRVGISRLRIAGIGAVATLETHRKKGLMAETAADCVAGLADAGYDASLLFGIPNFYHRFGYEVCFGNRSFVLETRDLKPAEASVETTLFEGDVTELADLYNRENETVTGTYVRPTYRRNRKPRNFRVRTFDGGYLITSRNGNRLQVADCAGRPELVVEAARSFAVQELCTEIEFALFPPRSVAGEYLQRLSHRVEASREASGGAMLLIVDLANTFEKLAAELSRRFARSAIAGYSGTIAVSTGEDEVRLVVDGGRVSVGAKSGPTSGTILARSGLARLIIGDGDPGRTAMQEGIELTGDARYLLPILFPDQEPSTILWDRF
jgi:predicted N-acetyltransferase YhbS